MLSGDGEVQSNPDQISQIAVEICKDGVLDLFMHKLLILGWEVSPHPSENNPNTLEVCILNYVFFSRL